MQEWVKHIVDQRTSEIERSNIAYCGERVGFEFAFTGVDHAVASRQCNDRLLPCSKCTKKIIELLKSTE